MKSNRYIYALILASLYANCIIAQESASVPKLVVTITIDQLRSDYMQAFTPLYSENGFKKLYNEGKVFQRAVNDFSPADRASAIATISTGATPYYNGIVSSSWLDRSTLRPVYCIADRRYKEEPGLVPASANKLLCTTIGDELKVYTQGDAKVFGIAPSSDAAILSVGHAADCALWIDDNTGEWVTSEYFKGAREKWIARYNEEHPLGTNIDNMVWQPSTETVTNITFFSNGEKQKPFRHPFTGDRRFVEFKRSALVNPCITDLALQCIDKNKIGTDRNTDLLAITYYAGTYKDMALADCNLELQDTYLRLDSEIAKLITNIENRVGEGNVLFVFTSTGYSETTNADYKKFGINTGTFYINRTANLLNMYLSAVHGQDQYVDGTFHNQIYLNHKLLEQKNLRLSDILAQSRDFLMMSDGTRDIYTSDRILASDNTDIIRIRNTYNTTLCGDIVIEVAPGWQLINEDTGESFCASASFNLFPIVFYGAGIDRDRISTLVTTDCIAPTISKCIRIRAPNGCKSLPLF